MRKQLSVSLGSLLLLGVSPLAALAQTSPTPNQTGTADAPEVSGNLILQGTVVSTCSLASFSNGELVANAGGNTLSTNSSKKASVTVNSTADARLTIGELKYIFPSNNQVAATTGFDPSQPPSGYSTLSGSQIQAKNYTVTRSIVYDTTAIALNGSGYTLGVPNPTNPSLTQNPVALSDQAALDSGIFIIDGLVKGGAPKTLSMSVTLSANRQNGNQTANAYFLNGTHTLVQPVTCTVYNKIYPQTLP